LSLVHCRVWQFFHAISIVSFGKADGRNPNFEALEAFEYFSRKARGKASRWRFDLKKLHLKLKIPSHDGVIQIAFFQNHVGYVNSSIQLDSQHMF